MDEEKPEKDSVDWKALVHSIPSVCIALSLFARAYSSVEIDTEIPLKD